MTNNKFPKDFFWGTATSSYQIEGAPDADGTVSYTHLRAHETV